MRRRRKRTRDEYHPIDNGDGTASVPLSTVHSETPVFSLIDAGDIARVSCIAWQHRVEPDGCEYALGMYHGAGKPRTIRLHRLLLCFPLFQVDHIDGDGLNNVRSNLRFCDNHQNQWNCRKNKPGKYSSYKGVTFHKASGLWKSQLQKNRKLIHTKYHKDPLTAALAYDAAAIEHFGEFAATNKKLGLLQSSI